VLQQGVISKVVYQICGIHSSGTLKLFKLGQRKNSNLSQVSASYWICLHTSVQSGIAGHRGQRRHQSPTETSGISDRGSEPLASGGPQVSDDTAPARDSADLRAESLGACLAIAAERTIHAAGVWNERLRADLNSINCVIAVSRPK
jgi:hypothetical protein